MNDNETKTTSTPKSYRERLLGPGGLTAEEEKAKAEQKSKDQERIAASLGEHTARLDAVIDDVPDVPTDRIGISVIKPEDVDLSGEFSHKSSPVQVTTEPKNTEKWDRMRELVAPQGPDYADNLRGGKKPDFKSHTPVAPDVSTKRHDADVAERARQAASQKMTDSDWHDYVDSVTG